MLSLHTRIICYTIHLAELTYPQLFQGDEDRGSSVSLFIKLTSVSGLSLLSTVLSGRR